MILGCTSLIKSMELNMIRDSISLRIFHINIMSISPFGFVR